MKNRVLSIVGILIALQCLSNSVFVEHKILVLDAFNVIEQQIPKKSKEISKDRTVKYFGKYHPMPIVNVKPEGWLKEILTRQKDGLGIHHAESGYPFNTCLWAGTIPTLKNVHTPSWWPYEQCAYMVDGLYRCGLAIGDTVLTNLGQRNHDFILNNPQDNGQLGLSLINNTQWPFTVFVRSLMANYDASHNPAILDALTKHFLSLHNDKWDGRDVCIIESMCWTYSHTKDKRLLAKAEHIWADFQTQKSKTGTVFKMANMINSDSVHGHGVTCAELGKQPAILYLYTGKEVYKKAAEGFFKALIRDHMLVDGVPSSALTEMENLGGKHAESPHETCDIIDYSWSMGYLLQATGNSDWGDKIERCIFNAGFGAISKDFRSLQYFSSPNQIIAASKNPISAKEHLEYGDRWAYRPGGEPACCSGNVHRMFPNFLSGLWLSDNENGIVASQYAPNVLHAKVGKNQVDATVSELTNYPFYGKIVFKLNVSKATKFPFTFRIPEWAEGATYSINNGKSIEVKAGGFHTINQVFKSGDEIVLNLPLQVKKETPVAGGVSLTRGPLLFSLNIKEDAKPISYQLKTSANFPAWEIKPATAWNYTLSLKDMFEKSDIKVVESKLSGFPFDTDNSPIKLIVQGKPILKWNSTKVSPSLPNADFETGEAQSLELVPSGSTRLRLSIFPIELGK